jgi:hypothetical protein
MPDPNARQVGQLSSTPSPGYWGMAPGAEYLYEFSIGDDNQDLNLSITNVVGNVSLSIYKDNGDGLYGSGDTYYGESIIPGNNHDQSIKQFDGKGTYFAVVSNESLTSNAYYNFTLSATPQGQASNLLPVNFEVGTLDYSNANHNSFSQNVFLTNKNTESVFHFHLDKTSYLDLILSAANQGDADVRLVKDINPDRIVEPDQNEVKGFSNKASGTNDEIHQLLDPGDYFVQVYKYNRDNIQVVPGLSLHVSTPAPA